MAIKLTAIIVIFPTFPPASTVLINWSMQIKVPESCERIVAWSFAFSLGPTFQQNTASRSRLLQHYHCNWDSDSKSTQNNHLFCQHQRCSEPTRAVLSQIDPRLVEHQALGSAGDHHDHGFSIFMSWMTNLSWIMIMRMVDDATHLDKLDKVGRLNRDTAISPRCELEMHHHNFDCHHNPCTNLNVNDNPAGAFFLMTYVKLTHHVMGSLPMITVMSKKLIWLHINNAEYQFFGEMHHIFKFILHNYEYDVTKFHNFFFKLSCARECLDAIVVLFSIWSMSLNTSGVDHRFS